MKIPKASRQKTHKLRDHLPDHNLPDQLLPDPHVCRRYGVSAMTLWRWDRHATLGFPPPIWINGRKYRRVSDLLAFDARRAAAPRPTPPRKPVRKAKAA